MSMAGHNAVDGSQLLSFIERIESLEAEKKQAGGCLKEVYAEARGTGFDAKIMRKIVAVRRKKADAVKEENEIFALYAAQLGMQTTFGV